MLRSSWIRYCLGPFLHFLSYYLKCHHSRYNHLVEPTEIQLTSCFSILLIPSDSFTTLPRNLHGQAVKTQPFLVPEIRDPRSTVLLKSTLEVWWLRSGGRSKRLGFPWWNCWMKQSPKFRWMNQSQTAWWLTYPSKKWWSSSVGMMTFPTEWQKNVPNHQAANSSQIMNKKNQIDARSPGPVLWI